MSERQPTGDPVPADTARKTDQTTTPDPKEHPMATTYRIEFGAVGTTRPVPGLVITEDDPNAFHRAVAAHAIPHLRPVLTAMGRPELADCFFRVDPADPGYGDFMWLDLAGGKGARFCPARITPVPTPAPAA